MEVTVRKLRDFLLREDGYTDAELTSTHFQQSWVYQAAQAVAEIAVVIAPMLGWTPSTAAAVLWQRRYRVTFAHIQQARGAIQREWDALQKEAQHGQGA